MNLVVFDVLEYVEAYDRVEPPIGQSIWNLREAEIDHLDVCAVSERAFQRRTVRRFRISQHDSFPVDNEL